MSDDFFDKVRALILAIGSLFILICIQIAGLYIFVYVCSMIRGSVFIIKEEPVLMAVFHIIYAIVAALIYGLLRRSYLRGHTDIGACVKYIPANRLLYILRLIILGIGIQAFAYGVLNLVNEFAAETAIMQSYQSTIDNLNGSTTYLIFVYTMLLAPVAEEMVFRGVIFDAAKSGFSFAAANCFQAVCFGLYHGNIVQFVYAFIIGMVLGYVRHISGRIIDAIGVHMVVNISGIIIVPLIAVFLMMITKNGPAAFALVGIIGLIIIIENIMRLCYNNSRIKRGRSDRVEN